MKKSVSCIKYIITSLGITCIICGGVALAAMGTINYKNSTGKGGLETPGLPGLTVNDVEGNNLEVENDIGLFYSNSVEENIDNSDELSYFSYRIKQGDMISVIAEKYGVTQDTIISVNNIRSSRLIQIGQYLKIPSMPGILYTVKTNGETVDTIAEKYEVDPVKCAKVNNMDETASLTAGLTLFVPDAEMDWVTRQEINGDLFVKPIHTRFNYSSYYGWRQSPFDPSKRTYHGGTDMACAQGTNIYAALDGTVTTAGWSDVYGNYVIVSHHSGYQTLYGHMSKITCYKGQHVGTSTVIGKVGSTGKSTGPHLHFAVYKNGRGVNPSSLWN